MTLRPEGFTGQMLFTHDAELTLRAAGVLINSDRVDGEQLSDQAALDGYLDGYGWTGRRDRDDAELAAVHRLRDRLGRIWAAADDEEEELSEEAQIQKLVLGKSRKDYYTTEQMLLLCFCTWLWLQLWLLLWM